MENWSKTLLESYRYMSTIVSTIDEMVKKITIGSMYYNSKSNSSTMSQINKVIDLNDRKLNLTNLKVIIEESLAKLNNKDLEVLSLYYIDGLNFAQIAETLEVSIRTVFRRKKYALTRFSDILSENVTKEYLFDNYKEETWLMDLYNYNVKKSSCECVLDEIELDPFNNGKEIFRALKELRKIAI